MQLFKIEKAKEADLPRILEIYARARQFMRGTGGRQLSAERAACG